MEGLYIGALTFGGLGLVAAAIGALLLRRVRKFLKRSAFATGTVTGVETKVGGRADTGPKAAGIPKIAFHTDQGERIEATTRFGSSAFNYREGDRVHIRYDPENPSAIAIDSFVGLWIIPVCLTGFGVCFMFVGLVIGVAVLI